MKEKRGYLLYRFFFFFVRWKLFKDLCFIAMYSVLNTLSEYIHTFTYHKNHYFIHFCFFLANICWYSRHVLKTSSRRLQRNNFAFSKTPWRRLQDLSQDVFKTSWKTKLITLKTSSRRFEDMSWRRLEDISWRRFHDFSEANKTFTGDICI